MQSDRADLLLGRLVQNLLRLEVCIRAFLARDQGGATSGNWVFADFDAQVGASVPLSAYTDYDTLGQLIDRYNTIACANGTKQLPPGIVELRDALAHGRLVRFERGEGPSERLPLSLVKYSKPLKGAQTVTVTYRQELTEAWFSAQRDLQTDALGIVAMSYIDGPF